MCKAQATLKREGEREGGEALDSTRGWEVVEDNFEEYWS